MLIAGFEKNSLLDYPGKVSSIIFTYGCNLRCPYCHNPELVIHKLDSNRSIPEEYILAYLKSRIGLIDGLVITGGEPTIQKDLIPFIKKVKNLGFLVKLDTNGTFSDIVQDIIKQDIVDYWAMDIKFPIEYLNDYGIDSKEVKKSIKLIMKSGKNYEFRTTYVKGIHDIEDAHDIGKLIKGSNNYYIQNFRTGKTIDPEMSEKNSFTEKELEKIKNIVSKYVKNVKIR